MTSDVKPRLRWTPELHGRFVDAVDHLEATPKAIMNVMKMRGLTLYQLKSHLQVPQHSSIDSFDSYMASLGYLPTLCSDGFAELGKGGGEGLRDSGEGLRDSDEDPALAYLNLDVGEMSTQRYEVAGDDSGWVAALLGSSP
ncbi:hypothetical protein C3L33_11775, partial [Rhododendron williamsianum]